MIKISPSSYFDIHHRLIFPVITEQEQINIKYGGSIVRIDNAKSIKIKKILEDNGLSDVSLCYDSSIDSFGVQLTSIDDFIMAKLLLHSI
jgi:hypothetical protein